jgi:phosphatidylinositol glycan class C protein
MTEELITSLSSASTSSSTATLITSTSISPGGHNTSRKSWRKVLYEKQSYPDNYIDHEKFLDQLNVVNNNSSNLAANSGYKVSYWGLVKSTTVVAHQFTVVVIFLSVYKYIVAGKITKYQLFMVDLSSLLILLITTRLMDHVYFQVPRSPVDSARRIFIAGVVLRVSAPILQTLTSSFSSNTVHALALILSTFHLITFDYNLSGNDEYVGNLATTMSLNAAVFTAVLLASRLKDIDLVVAFILLASIIFAILPGFGRFIKMKSAQYHLSLTILLYVLASGMLFHLNSTLFVTYELLIVFLWFLCPWWFQLLTAKYKKSLRGPWEEAIVPVPHNG